MDLAALEHVQAVAPGRLDDLYLHVGKRTAIGVQELRQHALDMLRRRGDLEHAELATPQGLGALVDRGSVGQQAAAFAGELLARAGQYQAAPHSVEQPEPEVVLELGDLARQRRLRDPQMAGRFRDSAVVDHGDEGARMPEIHGGFLCQSGISG